VRNFNIDQREEGKREREDERHNAWQDNEEKRNHFHGSHKLLCGSRGNLLHRMRPKPVKTPGLRYSVAAALPSYTSVTYDRHLDKTGSN
jgi:hypothetical protein